MIEREHDTEPTPSQLLKKERCTREDLGSKKEKNLDSWENAKETPKILHVDIRKPNFVKIGHLLARKELKSEPTASS